MRERERAERGERVEEREEQKLDAIVPMVSEFVGQFSSKVEQFERAMEEKLQDLHGQYRELSEKVAHMQQQE